MPPARLPTLLISALLTASVSDANGNIWHVVPSGDDAAAGTESAPWRTIQHAASLASAGDTVVVHSAGSPAIDAGTAQSAPEADVEGTPRPQGQGIDIGAYEWRGTPSTDSRTLRRQRVHRSIVRSMVWISVELSVIGPVGNTARGAETHRPFTASEQERAKRPLVGVSSTIVPKS